MAANTVLNYLPRKSFVHSLTGTTKLAFFLLFTFASMITYDTRVLIGLMAVSFAAFRASRIKLREVRFMLVFMLVFLILNNVFIYLFSPEQGVEIYGTRHVIVTLFWRYTITWEQLFYTLNISLKYFVALPVAILFISAKTGQGIDELLEMVNLQPPVTVEMREGTADITLNLIVRFGTCVPVMAEKVQKNVKAAVQSMTSITVSRVNVIVAGVQVRPEAAAE